MRGIAAGRLGQRVGVDLLAPNPGTVTARLLPEGGLDIAWAGFTGR